MNFQNTPHCICFFYEVHYNAIFLVASPVGVMNVRVPFNFLLGVGIPFSHRPFWLRPLNKAFISGILLFLLVAVGCNGSDTTPVSHGGPVRDHVSLVDTLRAQGLTVEPTGPISQPFFPIPGQTLQVNGQDVQVFEFGDSSSAESQVKEISSDGMTIGNTVVQWISPPHFFSTGKIIVLYVGTDPTLIHELEMAMGKQVAGGGP